MSTVKALPGNSKSSDGPEDNKGSWRLVSSPTTERILDRKGDVWTRFEFTYQLSPIKANWNPAFWRKS